MYSVDSANSQRCGGQETHILPERTALLQTYHQRLCACAYRRAHSEPTFF